MTPRPELPIEPLDEAAWARIEDGVVTAPSADGSPPPSPWRWVAAAGLAVACVALVAALWPRAGDAPAGTTRVSTSETASVVRLGEVTLNVEPHSRLVAVGSDATGWELLLSAGAVECDVPPRAERPPFVVLAGDVRVEVVGTRFSVDLDPELAVTVTRGAVRVVGPDDAVEVRAGEQWPAREVAVAPDPTLAPGRVSPAPAVDPSGPAGEAPSEEPAPSARALSHPRFDPAAEFARASRLEARNPSEADAVYAQVQRAGGSWAANALYARARLAAENGQPARARALLERYLRRHPDGLNAGDARGLLRTLEERP